MSRDFWRQVPVLAIMTLVGVFASAALMTMVRDNAAMFNASSFGIVQLTVVCVAMFICPFVVMLTTREIGKRLLIIVEVICVVLGLVATAVISGWQGDATVVNALLANSAADAKVVPMLNSPFGIIRNVMLFLLVPMVACVLGAWLGSRLHPVNVDKNNKNQPKKSNKKKRQG